MQLQQITTASLIARQDDLLEYAFPGSGWQKGDDGVITGIELPATFSSSTIQLKHWIPDESAITIDNEKNRVPLPTDHNLLPVPVLNIPDLGFFSITSISDNNNCQIDVVNPGYQKAINRWKGLEFGDKSIVEGSDYQWSLGTFEVKIATAYEELLSDLNIREMHPDCVDDFDASYKQALEYKSLELIYRSYTREFEDHWNVMSRKYGKLYMDQLNTIKTYTTEIAHKKWYRLS